MVETRHKKINKKVLKKQDIQNIWNILKSQTFSSREYRSKIEMQISCDDGTHYESNDEDLLSSGNIFDLKKVISIDIRYYNYDEDKRIDISINHGNSPYQSNDLKVKGSDKNWVAGTFSQFEDLLNSVKPQQHWLIQNKMFALCICTFIFIFFLINLLTLLTSKKLENVTDYSLILLIFAPLSFLISANLISWVLKLWPNIEFDFGPEYKKNEKNRRKRLYIFLSTILLPLVFSIIPSF